MEKSPNWAEFGFDLRKGFRFNLLNLRFCRLKDGLLKDFSYVATVRCTGVLSDFGAIIRHVDAWRGESKPIKTMCCEFCSGTIADCIFQSTLKTPLTFKEQKTHMCCFFQRLLVFFWRNKSIKHAQPNKSWGSRFQYTDMMCMHLCNCSTAFFV